jgi:hypothetical protein
MSFAEAGTCPKIVPLVIRVLALIQGGKDEEEKVFGGTDSRDFQRGRGHHSGA